MVQPWDPDDSLEKGPRVPIWSLSSPVYSMSWERQSLWQKVREMEIHSERSPWVCVCACVCVLCVCMCACWGILVTLMAFISGQWNAAKTFSLLSCCSYTDTPMNAHSTYIPCKENCYSCCMSIQWGSSSVLSQYLNFFFFKIQEKAQMYPRECERMRRSWQQLPPLCICSLKGLQGAMKEKSVRQPGELRAGCRVHTGVRASEPSS